MEQILEIHEYGKSAKQRQLDRKEFQKEDQIAGKEGNILKNDRQKFSKMSGSHKVVNEINKAKNIQYTKVSRNKDKDDYALVEKVIDKKTEAMFARWQESKFLGSVEGCISTGKEANVYYAPKGEDCDAKGDFAIKIFKVETMVFRDREDYIQGEFRFRKGKSIQLQEWNLTN
jgi:serine/threonine-protein kinase RIO1